MQRAGLALAVAALLLAGCSGGDPPAGPDPAPSSAPPSSSAGPAPPAPGPPVIDLLVGFSLEDCRGVSVRQGVPVADVQALLPPGFTALVVEGSQAGGASDGLATVAVDLYACGSLAASSARVNATHYGQAYTLVERPEGRVPGAPEAAFHEYVFRVLAGEDVLAALWPAAGYDTRSGPASVRVGPPLDGLPADGGLRTADGAVGADYAALASGSTAAPVAVTGPFARYTALADGSVLVWTGTYGFPAAASGTGSSEVAGDDAFAPFALGGSLRGLALLHESGGMEDMDLRRVFTPP